MPAPSYDRAVLECVPNVSEGRHRRVVDELARACGRSLLDVHPDPDHHRSVFTLAGPGPRDCVPAVHGLARSVARLVDLRLHDGAHPRLGALDVVPFVALGEPAGVAVEAARTTAAWLAGELAIPVFLYGDADPAGCDLPSLRRDAFVTRAPDLGPGTPHPTLGATAVGARPPLAALNCWLDRDDVGLAREIARSVRARDGGLPGVRALGLRLASRERAQVSMNLTDLDATGIETACRAVAARAGAAGAGIDQVELVGLVPRAALAACSDEFLARTGLTDDQSLESRLARPRAAS